ncbi:DUF3857 domain-containing protein [Flavobacterium sp. W1B]|uniref:DUF3857 domain-containing protein n=1 Tax=Flavobacterium sp. W1B TaxID=3394146 RepID=UPI0039BCA03A
MKIKTFISAFLLIVFVSKTNAQEFKLGKVNIAELEEKEHLKDPTAVAAVLFNKGEVQFEYSQDKGFEMVTEVRTRIKIYKKEGYDWANKTLQYYLGSNLKENISFSDAITYNLVDGKIEKTKLKSEGEFDEKINKYWGRKKIVMPNVKEGSVIEYRYTVKSPRIAELKEWNFQTSIPVNYSEFKTFIPEYFVYKPNQKGYVFPKVTVEKGNKSIVINNKERSGGGGLASAPIKATFSQDKINYQETQTTYLGENLPAMKGEAFVNNIDNYTSSVSHELAMTKFPNSLLELYSTDWESVAKKIYESEGFGIELKKTGYFEEDINKLLVGLNTQEDKITAIFNFVKNRVKWNDFYGYSCDEGVKKAYKDKVGNVAEINLMLTAMLRHAGINANPVLVSTRSNGIALFPNRTAFNYVIAAVETANGNVLLDASDKFSIPNVLPFRALNWTGRLIRKDGTSDEVDLMPRKLSNDIVFMTYNIDSDGKVIGKARRQNSDYNAMITRANIDSVKEDEYLEKLENRNNKIEISEYSRTNEKDIFLPITETYSFAGGDLCELIGGKIYVNPMLFFGNDKNPFTQEVREYPVDFGFPFLDKYNIMIQIPEGFSVETLPTPAVIVMEDNLGTFKYEIALNGDKIQLLIQHQINDAIVGTEKYEMLKEYYKKKIAKESEKIVLKRI